MFCKKVQQSFTVQVCDATGVDLLYIACNKKKLFILLTE
jgi:hypothetical protein